MGDPLAASLSPIEIPIYRFNRPKISVIVAIVPVRDPPSVALLLPALPAPKPARATSFEDIFSGASCEFTSFCAVLSSLNVFSSESGPEWTTPTFCICTNGGSCMGVGSFVLVVVACVVVDVVDVVDVVVVGTTVPFSIQYMGLNSIFTSFK